MHHIHGCGTSWFSFGSHVASLSLCEIVYCMSCVSHLTCAMCDEEIWHLAYFSSHAPHVYASAKTVKMHVHGHIEIIPATDKHQPVVSI